MREIEFNIDLPEPTLKSAKPKAYTVTEINREIRALLESEYAHIWVEAEISNLKKHSSGHYYLTLKDDKSQISSVFFRQHNHGLKFDLKDGLQVLVMGKISLYEARGQYQFYIERIEPKGMGALQLAFIQLKEKLESEGLFDPAHKKRIPKFPRVVGVVTSPTGAAIRDILNVINRRFCGTTVLLNPVQVQGEGAAPQIARAIEEMNALGGIDVLIVGRGGGSLEDLWAFNEEKVARAVYASKIPVISAVGHEIDWTICDLVADLRAPTPSAAAELVVQSSEELNRRVQDSQVRMRNCMISLIAEWRVKLDGLQESYAFKQPGVLIDQYSQRVDELLRQLQNYLKSYVQHQNQKFQSLAGKLNALSPLSILERGYSLSFTQDGTLLKDARSIKVGETLTSRLWKGTLHAKVTRIELEESASGQIRETRKT
jgi:exodeoxyribonuclease VII large subunit